MIKKILIANRGEIAVRIIRACKEMEIQTVAVFSEPDRTSLHVLKADEAYCIGPAPSSESYLNIKSILNVIMKANVDAVHPGYGFLSENKDFAKCINDLNIIWIGPSAKVINIMGDKIAARKLAIKVGAPIIPGYQKSMKNITAYRKVAKEIGYPIIIKAAGGGGGKGMRIIKTENELEDSINRTKSEANNAFSDNRVYIEKYLEDPHHIEIQIFADNNGNIVSLGERECSIQRRYQKIIEETPSPFINTKIRKELSDIAIKITQACNYVGAGTIEFLVDKNNEYYFLEMNTRLQVEHPITEMTTGVDLVKEQISVAMGNSLSFTKNNIYQRGHAIECRIYAEDGFNNFIPSTGLIKEMITPSGLGVRLDEGIYIGQEVTPYYDPLLAKLIVWGDSRKIAIKRMIRALEEFHISGIKSSIPISLLIIKQLICFM